MPLSSSIRPFRFHSLCWVHAAMVPLADIRQQGKTALGTTAHSIKGSPLRLQAMRGMLLPGPCKYCRPCKQIGGTSACMTN